MTNKEAVIGVLKEHSCLTGFQIKGFAHRMFGVDITPQTASGVLRPLVAAGYAGKSTDPVSGKMAYWLTDYGKEKLFNGDVQES